MSYVLSRNIPATSPIDRPGRGHTRSCIKPPHSGRQRRDDLITITRQFPCPHDSRTRIHGNQYASTPLYVGQTGHDPILRMHVPRGILPSCCHGVDFAIRAGPMAVYIPVLFYPLTSSPSCSRAGPVPYRLQVCITRQAESGLVRSVATPPGRRCLSRCQS